MFVVLFVSTFSKSHNWAMEANKNSNFPHRIPVVLIAASRAATQEHDQQDDGENNAAYYPLVDPVIFPADSR